MKKILLLFILLIFTTLNSFASEESKILPAQIGIINNINYIDNTELEDTQHVIQQVEVKILKGKYKNQNIIIENILTGNPYYDINLKKGVKVILHTEQEDDKITFSIENIYRSNLLVFLIVLFGGILIYVGKKKGIYSLVSIILTCLLIIYLLSPLILRGFNPIFATIIACIFSTVITIYLVGGFNRKSTAAVIGCMLSIIIAGIISIIIIKLSAINGFTDEQTMFLYASHPELNFVAILVSTMILATLGAVMDVAMSIASTINEIYTVDSSKTIKELFTCGMNVGKDVIGTMANTLILVYLGASLPLLLLASNIDLLKFVNLNQVFVEIASALIGSCAIVICVPITAIVSSELIKKAPPEFKFPKLQD